MKQFFNNQFVRIALAILSAVLVTLAVIYIVHKNSANSQLNSTLTSVGKLMLLPTNEKPALAVVTDQSKLQSSLKAVALTGDDVLVYETNGIVIVYRPSINKIVTVQPILVGSQPDASLNITVGILNGSGDSGKLERFVSSLYQKYPNIRLISKSDAKRLFPNTIVYGSSKDDGLAAEIALDMKIQAGQIPEGITKSAAAVDIIVGQDAK